MEKFTDEKINEYLKDPPMSASEAAIMSGTFRLIALQLQAEVARLAAELSRSIELNSALLENNKILEAMTENNTKLINKLDDDKNSIHSLHNEKHAESRAQIQTLSAELAAIKKAVQWFEKDSDGTCYDGPGGIITVGCHGRNFTAEDSIHVETLLKVIGESTGEGE